MSSTNPAHAIDESLKTPKKKSTIIDSRAGKPKAAKAAHYVDNQKFFDTLMVYLDAADLAEKNETPMPKIPEYVGECVLKICERLATMHYFYNYTYKDEMIGVAVETCIKKVRKFNPNKTHNPFGYFTQIAYYTFLQVIEEENTKIYVRYKSLIDTVALANLADGIDDTARAAEQSLSNVDLTIDRLEEFVGKFEKKRGLGAYKKSKSKAKTQADSTVTEIFGA